MSIKLFVLGAVVSGMSFAQASDLNMRVDRELDAIAPRIIEWRRDFHRNPELSNREFRTSRCGLAPYPSGWEVPILLADNGRNFGRSEVELGHADGIED